MEAPVQRRKAKPDRHPPMPERVAVSTEEAAHMLGTTRQFIYLLMRRGDLASVNIGRCRRIPISEIHRLATEGTKTGKSTGRPRKKLDAAGGDAA